MSDCHPCHCPPQAFRFHRLVREEHHWHKPYALLRGRLDIDMAHGGLRLDRVLQRVRFQVRGKAQAMPERQCTLE